jgi:hypothetical protein
MLRVTGLLLFVCFAVFAANETADRASRLEDSGDSGGARDLYVKAIRVNPQDPELLSGYAGMLERYHDPGARAAFRRSAAVWKARNNKTAAAADQRRAVLLDLIADDRAAADSDLSEFRALGGTGLTLPTPVASSIPTTTTEIPGPLRSFARMAAIAQDSGPDTVLTALARNVVTNGFQASHSSEELEETEYLKLVRRYLSQARELEKLAGPDKVIRITTCESTQTNDLLRILGFRMRGGCGAEVVLETLNAPRAFLTTDSGFPIAQLEESLRTDKPFSLDFKPTKVNVLYSPDYWISSRDHSSGDFIDTFLTDPSLCRFYLGMSKLDPETADTLRRNVAATRLRAFANVLDFFGGNFEIRQGHAVVPGGPRANAGWAEIAGVSPDKGPEFMERLLQRDDGWMAALYDALARINGPVQDYLTDAGRMKRYYGAIRGRITTPGPARPVFRSNADMMLLTTRIHLDANGQAHLPGGIEPWRSLFEKNPRGKYDAKLSRAASAWKDPDDVIEALFALTRKPVDNEPLKIFMALSDIDRGRTQPLQTTTVERIIRGWGTYGAQYTIFGDAPGLSDKSIVSWLDAADFLDKLRDPGFRQNSIAMFQGLTGLWQIFCRQGSITPESADGVLASIAAPFATLKNNRELFDAGRGGLTVLIKVTGGSTGPIQERVLNLLAGGAKIVPSDARAAIVLQEQRIFEAQKLLSADLIFDLADNLEAVTKGEKLNSQLAARLAARVADIQLPRSSMTATEKNSLAFGFWVDKHIDDERKLNFRALIDKAAKDPEKLKDIRGQLAASLRDTLVGYNYIHYAPPGAQILQTNPLFVRGHDFIGMQGANHSWRPTELHGTGWPANAGGRLIGSLAGLPYALAEAEQNFLIPKQTQALIWGDLVPQMILTATTPRFWAVTPAQLHYVGLNMRAGDALVAEAALNPALRPPLMEAVGAVASPFRTAQISTAIESGNVRVALDMLMPSELYLVAQRTAEKSSAANPAWQKIAQLRSANAAELSPAVISRTFGSPKPTLANSYRQELLNLRTFPTLMGYSSRIMAESWESNLLYWADIADQIGVAPGQMNLLVPEWTQKVVERIFASHLEDWPALLRSMHSVGDEIRAQSQPEAADKTGNQ